MLPDRLCAEERFLYWLLALPEYCDAASAAALRLTELRSEADEDQRRWRELLRQVTPFALPASARRGGRGARARGLA